MYKCFTVMDRHFLTLIICLLWSFAGAQTLTIRGQVADADTKEGIPFSNVYFAGTTIGVATDVDGFYELTTDGMQGTLVASAVSYLPLQKIIGPDSLQTINFYLAPTSLTLSEVVVIAGENPANRIVRGIIDRKAEIRIEALNSFHYESYSKIELDLEKIPDKLQKSKLMKPFAFIFENMDSTSDEIPFLPIYMNEILADVYYIKGEGRPKVIPKAQRTSDVENQTLVEFIWRIHDEFSIYDNWISVLDKAFISPFSNFGLGYYEYYIIDSTFMNGYWSYQLKFKPKRKQENTFYGDFWVADTVFAVQQVNMRMAPDVNINLVNRIIINQQFDPVNGYWLPRHQKMIVDFKTIEKGPGMIARRTETFRDFRVNQHDISTSLLEKDPDPNPANLKRDDEFWESARHIPLSETEATIYQMIDSIQNVPIYKTYVQIAETLFTGYLKAGPVEFGPYFSTYSYNAVEGHRIRLGARTGRDFSKIVQLSAYGAYGFKDDRFKYGGEFRWLHSKEPRKLLGIAFIKDISLSSENSEDFQGGDLFSGAFRRNIYQKLIDIDESKIYYERWWDNGFSNRLTLLNRNMDPLGHLTPEGGGFNYAYINDLSTLSDIDTTINTTELIFNTRYAFEETVIDGRFSRTSVTTKFPIIELQYALGIKGLWGSDYNYHRLQFSYRHWFPVGPIGWLSYRFSAGKVFGDVPFLLMSVHPGNESYFMTRAAFNTMNLYEFASDTYFSFILEHHFDGFLLNKIPLMRKLNMRTVILFKGVMGSITSRNLQANRLNLFEPKPYPTYTGFRTPSRVPFMEAGVGIENILKFIRVDALWRLSYLDNPEAARFVVLLGVYFYF